MPHSDVQPAPVSKATLWAGRVVSALIVLMLLFGGGMGIAQPPEAVQGMAQFGYPAHLGPKIGVVAIACAVLYAIPQTAVLGAVLLTGYLGGATATHVRVGDPFVVPVVVGVLVWLGLYLRDRRVRALMPFRKV